MSSSFGNPDAQTPHGGPPFQGWRQGFGFGKAKGPGGYNDDPSVPRPGRATPGGDRYFSSCAFWRRRSEVGQAAGFGIGDRPDYGSLQDRWSLHPAHYGDISKDVPNSKD